MKRSISNLSFVTLVGTVNRDSFSALVQSSSIWCCDVTSSSLLKRPRIVRMSAEYGSGSAVTPRSDRATRQQIQLDDNDVEALTTIVTKDDLEGIALLRQIFPDLSVVELHKLHTDRLLRRQQSQGCAEQQSQAEHQPTSLLGRRLWKEWLSRDLDPSERKEEISPTNCWRPIELPDDFLQLPPSLAVRRFNDKSGKWYYLVVKRLEEQVLEQHAALEDFLGSPVHRSENQGCYSRVIHRDVKTGLGMSLCEEGGRVWVHSLLGQDGRRWFTAPSASERGGPAMAAGVKPGHWLLGINGRALLPKPSDQKTLLRDAVSAIQYSADPVVLHLREIKVDSLHPLAYKNETELYPPLRGPSLLDVTTLSLLDENSNGSPNTPVPPPPRIHPFVVELDAKGLMKGIEGRCKSGAVAKAHIDTFAVLTLHCH